MAFAARYGHTGPHVTRHWPLRELKAFNDAVNELIAEEAAAMKGPGSTD